MAKNPLDALVEQMWSNLMMGGQIGGQNNARAAQPDLRYPPTSLNPPPEDHSARPSSTIGDLVRQAREEANPRILHQIAEQLLTEGNNI